MSDRNTRLILKRSNLPGKVPTTAQLKLGELALNTADVKAYAGYTGGLTGATEIRQIGWDRVSISGDTLLGKLEYNQDFSPFTGNEIPSAQWVLDQVSGSTDVYVTGMTWNTTGNTLTLERNDGTTITENINITNIEGDLTISGKTVGDSIFKTWAQWYRNDNTIYTVTPVSTPVKIGSQFTGDTFSPNSKGFTYSGGTLTFDGSATEQQFHLTVSMTAEASANNQLYDFWVAVNGVQLTNIVIANELGTKKESVSLTGIVPLNPGDYMELYARNNTANKNILLSSINFSAIQI
jgi:hypothetical protein